ncbi:MAG: hypothetical protein OXN44_03795 [Acidimicrobiaceae bacterium]|nr:hypothetical protein [Acidimicrobiaceae bacterium]
MTTDGDNQPKQGPAGRINQTLRFLGRGWGLVCIGLAGAAFQQISDSRFGWIGVAAGFTLMAGFALVAVFHYAGGQYR